MAGPLPAQPSLLQESSALLCQGVAAEGAYPGVGQWGGQIPQPCSQ